MDWVTKSLGEVCKFQGGSQPPKSTFVYEPKEGYVRLIQIRDYKSDKHVVYIPSELAKRHCTKDEVMIGRYGPPIFQILKGIDGAYNVALMKAIPDENVLDRGFLYLFLKSPAIQKYVIDSSSRAAGQSGVNKPTLESFQISFPKSLEQQKRIVSILSDAFEGIDSAIANTQKNLVNAQELFESKFIQIFHCPDRDQETEPLSSLCDFIVDCEHKTAPIQTKGIPSIRTPNIGFGELLLDNVNRVSEETYEIWTRRGEPKAGDLILAREAPAGNIAIVPEGEKVCLGQRTVLIRPNNDFLFSKYLAYLILHPVMQKELLGYSKGATVQHINMKDIRSFPIGKLPTLAEQQMSSQAVSRLLENIQQIETIYQQKLTALKELKQSLLAKAFSGELSAKPEKVLIEAAG